MGYEYYLVIDAGTTAIKVFAYDDSGKIIRKVANKVPVSSPKPGWVEQDPLLYWEKVFNSVKSICDELGRPLAVGVTNQRATTVVWDKDDGEPLHNMITWQDTRAFDLAEELSKESLIRLGRLLGSVAEAFAKIVKRVGESRSVKYLITMAHFKFGSNQPGVHLRWLMDNVNEFARAVRAGKAAFGTLDSWILWNMVGKHVIDFTNASATGMFDPFHLRWSDRLTKILGIPLLLSHMVTKILGRRRVAGVEVVKVDEDLKPISGTEKVLECDTVIVAAGIVPKAELLEEAGALIDRATHGPIVNDFLETTLHNVFAAGNALIINDLVDHAAEQGERVAESAAYILGGGEIPHEGVKKVVLGRNVRLAMPQLVTGLKDVYLHVRVKKPEENVRLVVRELGLEVKMPRVRPAEMIRLPIRRDRIAAIGDSKLTVSVEAE